MLAGGFGDVVQVGEGQRTGDGGLDEYGVRARETHRPFLRSQLGPDSGMAGVGTWRETVAPTVGCGRVTR
ncbi:hypothetical protein GCM10010195_40160 [Kitasatospora griseola]|nr:hypothetical protein GCM10010195_40160 [Kitasatospora griseola]